MPQANIEIEDMITVGDLANKLMIPVTNLIGELMKNGIMITVNERIDFETAQIILDELKLPDIKLVKKPDSNKIISNKREKNVSENAQSRPPVVAVMGHVDHGKTSLLDAIKGGDKTTKVEAGGITQHISAYQIKHGDRSITFLDTPGHEAFASLREHGAHLTDLVVLVVAADDGVKPQTKEAIRFARKAGVKIVVALNKIDKETANPDLVLGQLAELKLVTDKWQGGDTPVAEVSAKTGQGIDDLLDILLLVADIEDIKADLAVPAKGLIIESHMEKGRGLVAVALVEAGILKAGSTVVVGTTYGKIRNLESTLGETISEAGPSTPVLLTGLRSLPEFGDEFNVVKNEKEAKKQVEIIKKQQVSNNKSIVSTSSQLLRMINRNIKASEFNVIIKADVQGSLTSVIDSLKTLENEEVSVRVVGSGVGNITDNDLQLAITSNAVIYGFNVDLPSGLRSTTLRSKISVRQYKIIYELIDDVKEELTSLLSPEIIENEIGRLVVKGVFKTTKEDIIAGGEVTKGKLVVPALANIFRDGEKLAEAAVVGLKRGPTETKEVLEGEMCGIHLQVNAKLELQEGDRIDVYTRSELARKL